MSMLVLAASRREGSYNRKLAEFAATIAKKQGHTPDWIEYADIQPPLFNDPDLTKGITLPSDLQKFALQLAEAERVIIATPEYNWSIPGHLKNMIDWLSCLRPYPFFGKKILLIGASPSRRGGLLGLTHLQMILASMGAYIHPQFFSLVLAHQSFDENGELQDDVLNAELNHIVKNFCES